MELIAEALPLTVGDHLNALMISTLFGAIMYWLARRQGFFQYPPTPFPERSVIGLGHVIGAFLLYFALQVLLMSLFSIFAIADLKGDLEAVESQIFTSEIKGWITLIATAFTGLVVIVFSCTYSKALRRAIWGSGDHVGRDVGLGVLTWFIAAPIMNAVGQLAVLILLQIYPDANIQIDQISVDYLKKTFGYPALFGATIVVMVILVPMIEEVLFRGFLQSWLCDKLNSRRWGIILTSIVFAGFHFSISQGFANVELISALFVLSCFLGFIYERQQSLWASIGLHAFFNAASIAMIVLVGVEK